MTAPDAADLVEKYIRLAYRAANKWAVRHPDLRDELVSEATYTLWRVALAFDPSRGTNFATWFLYTVRWRFLNLLRSERRHPAPGGPLVELDGEPVPLVELLPDDGPPPDANAEHADELTRLGRLLGQLPDRRRELLVRHVGHGECLEALGDEQGVSRVRAGQLVGKALRQVRQTAGEW